MLIMDYEQKINDVIKTATTISVYNDGKKTDFNADNKKFAVLLNNILSAFEGSFIMPAFSVSLNEETLVAMQSGKWIEIKFDEVKTINELPFTSLLFRLDDCYGVNLIREFNGQYSGRCIYLNLSLKIDLTNIIKSI